MTNIPIWTEDDIEKLRELASKGLTAGAIATAIGGGRTRNAIIGKLHRLGIRKVLSIGTRVYDSFWSRGDNLRKLAGYVSSSNGYSRVEIGRHFGVGMSTVRRGLAKLRAEGGSIKGIKPTDIVARPNRPRKRGKKRTLAQIMAGGEPTGPTDLYAETVPECACDIAGLSLAACRWPVLGQGWNMRYCGRQIVNGTPYCVGHCLIAYQPRHK